MNESQTAIILIVVLIALIIITLTLLYAWSVIFSSRGVNVYIINNNKAGTKVKKSNHPPKLGEDAGASFNGRYYNSGFDICDPPMWGPDCSLNSYDEKYVNYGVIDTKLIKSENIGERELSFYPDSCTSTCDQDKDCKGVIWQNNICGLIREDVVLSKSELPIFNPLEQGNIFLKKSNLINIDDTFYAYRSNRPNIYWNNENVIELSPYRLYRTDFDIDGFIGYGEFKIFMSDEPFDNVLKAKIIINSSSEYQKNKYRFLVIIPYPYLCTNIIC